MRVRRLVVCGLLLLVLGAAVSCGAAPRERPGSGARVEIAVLAGGGARVDLYAAGRLRSDAEVRELAGRIARETFPGAARIGLRTGDGRGLPYGRAEVARAYRPGAAVALRIDTGPAWRRLAALGFGEAVVRLGLPSVPASVRTSPGARPAGARAWRVRAGAPPPVLDVELRPEPARWFGVMALPVLGAAGAAVAFLARRRAVAVPAALAAVGAAVAAVPLAAGGQGDNLGVAGMLGGRALDVAAVLPLSALAFALPAGTLLAVMAVWRPAVSAGGAGRVRRSPSGPGG
ncbi:hypothetical protein [Actinomadura parmotrematis]|uniref:DUF4436 domain-containing protein n=1 Tax=Actinomadura parmotrematis TaxID=2864039 RepID=A0ABS7FNA5_9ACTN|nr:hypothetical protein [Actinomadura parmotrematis]MBW8481796.1 hypothetical protein [Actinomadura parmotrematis]